jgi:hypothetical protein
MSRRTTLTITLALGLALAGGAGAARAADEDYTGQEISTIRSLDPTQHIVVLSDGTELLVTDPNLFAGLHEGELVKIDFTHEGGRTFVNSIVPAGSPADPPSASPGVREPSPYDEMHVGEGQVTGAHTLKGPAGPSVIFDGDDSGGGERLDSPEAP